MAEEGQEISLTESESGATWPSVARDLVRGGYSTIWRLIDRERLGVALAFFILLVLGLVALVLAVKMPSESVGPVLKALLDLIGKSWAFVALAVSLLGNLGQRWNYKRMSAIMQGEIDRQAQEKRELQEHLVTQLDGRSSREVPVLEPSDDV